MRRGWFLFLILNLTINLVVWYATYWVMNAKITHFHDVKMAVRPEWKTVFERDSTDMGALFKDANASFEDGDYNYCKAFYERSKNLRANDDRTLVQIEPLYLLSLYSLNANNSAEFQKAATMFIDDLASHKDRQEILGVIIWNFDRVRKRMDESDRDFIKQVVDRLIEIKKTAPN